MAVNSYSNKFDSIREASQFLIALISFSCFASCEFQEQDCLNSLTRSDKIELIKFSFGKVVELYGNKNVYIDNANISISPLDMKRLKKQEDVGDFSTSKDRRPVEKFALAELEEANIYSLVDSYEEALTVQYTTPIFTSKGKAVLLIRVATARFEGGDWILIFKRSAGKWILEKQSLAGFS